MELFHWEEEGGVPFCIFAMTNAKNGIKSDERLPMKFSKLVEHVSKKPIPPHVHHLVVEVMVSDDTGEDVEVRVYSSTILRLLTPHRFLS